MKLCIIFSLIIVVAAALPERNVLFVREALGLSQKIISGQPAAEAQFPWQVLNRFRTLGGSAICGGALINTRWVLTAGHCAYGAYHFKITLGSLRSDGNLEDHARVVETNTAIVNPNYEPYFILNDVALVYLKEDVTLSKYIQTILLGSEELADGVKLTVSGWGKISDQSGVASPTLNFVNLVTITNQKCIKVYGFSINDGTICCVGAPEHSTCNGDSGGPLVQYKNGSVYHTGVVSFVHRNGCASGNPSGYARTSFYRSWIQDTITNTSVS